MFYTNFHPTSFTVIYDTQMVRLGGPFLMVRLGGGEGVRCNFTVVVWQVVRMVHFGGGNDFTVVVSWMLSLGILRLL